MDYELIFWCVIGVACLVFISLCVLCGDHPKEDNIKIEYVGGRK